MADIAREGSEVVLKLSTGERIMAVHRDVRVPLSAVKIIPPPPTSWPSTPRRQHLRATSAIRL